MNGRLERGESLHGIAAGDLPCRGSSAMLAMSDDAFYSPNRQPPPPLVPKAGEPLWSVRHNHVTWSCELRFHGESYGWEATLLRDGELVTSHGAFVTKAAVQWANARRDEIEGGLFA